MKTNIKIKPKSSSNNNLKSAFNQMMNPTSKTVFENDEAVNNEITEFFQAEENSYFMEEPVNEVIEQVLEEPVKVYEKTIIGDGVEINGNIFSRGDIDILGIVNGNVVSEGSLAVSGTIHGNLEAELISINQGKVYGDTIQVKKDIRVNDSEVKANINGENIIVNANVTGNLTAIQAVNIMQNSTVLGDVFAKRIAVQEGAIIEGQFKTTK